MATEQEVALRLYAALKQFPDDGQLQNSAIDADTRADLILIGLVERQEVQKACKTCGTPRFDYAFYRMTPAGHLFVWVMDSRGVL